MSWFRPKTLIATVGSVALPLAALAYLASLPGRGSAAAILLQVAIVLVGLGLFAMLLARLVEQVNAGRVGRWLESPEGRDWLGSLPEEERDRFLANFERRR